MAKKERSMERIVTGSDRKTAQALRKVFLKVLSKDKKSDDVKLTYVYRAFRKKADYAIEGSPKTISKCVKAFDKFVKAQEKKAQKKAKKAEKSAMMPKAKYYAMKPSKDRKPS